MVKSKYVHQNAQPTLVNIHIIQCNVCMSANFTDKQQCLHTLSAFADVLYRQKNLNMKGLNND